MNFHILFRASTETSIRREAISEEVYEDTVWDALNVDPAANQSLHQFPRLFAQTFLTQSDGSIVIDSEHYEYNNSEHSIVMAKKTL